MGLPLKRENAEDRPESKEPYLDIYVADDVLISDKGYMQEVILRQDGYNTRTAFEYRKFMKLCTKGVRNFSNMIVSGDVHQIMYDPNS